MGNRLLLGFRVVQQQARKHLDCIIAYFGLAVAYLIIYRDVVFFPRLIAGIDFQIRSSLEPWRFYYTDWSIWSSLGSRAGLGWTNWGGFQNAIFGAISFGSEVLTQKLMFSGILVASFAMFFFLKDHVTKITPVAFIGAIIYAYSPLTTVNYGTGLIWELAYLPLVINYLVNIFREKASFKDSCLFAITLSFMIGFGVHVVPFIALTVLALSLAFLPANRLSFGRFVRSLKYLTLAIFLFVIINPGIVMTALYLFLGRSLFSSGYTGYPGLIEVNPQTFIGAYAPWTVLQQLTLMNYLGWSSGVSIGWKPLGVVFSIIAFASPLFRLERDLRKLVLVFSIMYILIILFVLNVQAGTNFFLWLFNYFPFIRIMARNTAGPSWYMGFVLATLITVTISKVGSRFVKRPIANQIMTTRKWSFYSQRQTWLQRLKLTSLLLILLFAYFVYVPSYSPTAHVYAQGYFNVNDAAEPVPNPQVYTVIIDFLKDKSAFGSYRYFLVPNTFLAGSNLLNGNPNIFGPSLSLPTSQVSRYLSYVDRLIVNNETNSLGTLLAPANVKYIIVILNSTEPTATMGFMTGGPGQVSPSGLYGDPQAFVDFLSRQSDLKMVAKNQYFAAYENVDFLPYITCFPSMTSVIGDLTVMPLLSTLPGYRTNSTLLFFNDESLDALHSALGISSHFLFYNRASTDLTMSYVFNLYGINLGSLGLANAGKVAEEWVWVDDSQSDSGLLTYGNGYLETTSEKSLEIPFFINGTANYSIWARVLYSTYSNGFLSFKINDVSLCEPLRTQTDIDEGFSWINLGNLTLEQGQYNLAVDNTGGYNALGGIIIVPTDEIVKAQNLTLVRLSSNQALYLYDMGSQFVTVATKDATMPVSGRWCGLGNFSNSTDRVVGNQSYLSEVIAGPQNSFRALIGCHLSTLENWNDEDFVQLWIKSSTPKLQFYLYSDKEASKGIAYWEFTVIPNTWTPLQILLGYSSYGEVGAFQVHAVASDVNETVRLYVNQVSVGRVLETSYMTSTYLPPGEYSIAFTPSSKINASLININLGGNTLHVANDYVNWSTSSMVVLEGGDYNLTLTLPGGSKIDKIAIVTGSLHEFWDKDECLNLNYTSEDYSSYSVTTNSKAPFFIVLSEAFDVGWQASFSDQKVIHFKAFSFTNAFYLPATGLVTLKIAFSPSTVVLLNRMALAFFIAIVAIVVVNFIYRRTMSRRRCMNSECNRL